MSFQTCILCCDFIPFSVSILQEHKKLSFLIDGCNFFQFKMCSHEWIAFSKCIPIEIIYFYENNFHALKHFVFSVSFIFGNIDKWILIFFLKFCVTAIKEFLRNKLTSLKLYTQPIKSASNVYNEHHSDNSRMSHCYIIKVTLRETKKNKLMIISVMSVASF